MSKRNVLLVAIVSALLVLGFFFWPEPAKADFEVAGRFGGGVGHSGVSGRVHRGDGGFRGGGFRGGVDAGTRDIGRRGGFRGRGAHARRGPLLGDRFRVYQHDRIAGRRLPSAVHLGDVELFAQRERLNAKFRGDGRKRHRRKDWRGKGVSRWLHPEPYYPYFWPGAPGVPGRNRTIVIVQVQAPPPAAPAAQAAPPPEPLDPRGRVTVVGEENGIVGDWSEGDVLPQDLPYVSLDYAAYGLPIPPLGDRYARVGNDVLRIDAGTRRIEEVVAR